MYRIANDYMEQMNSVNIFYFICSFRFVRALVTAFKKLARVKILNWLSGKLIWFQSLDKLRYCVVKEDRKTYRTCYRYVVTSDSAIEKIKAMLDLVQSVGH